MYGFVTVLEGSGDYPREVGLLFVDKNSAEQFFAFANMYKLECGEQYGWEAYLASSATSGGNKIFGVDKKMGRGFLDLNLIKKMAAALCAKRIGPREYPEYFPLVGAKNGAIVFSFNPDGLPRKGEPACQ